MNEMEKVINGLQELHGSQETMKLISDALTLLKEQENLKQKMWNALYAEEDDLEEKFIGTENTMIGFLYIGLGYKEDSK